MTSLRFFVDPLYLIQSNFDLTRCPLLQQVFVYTYTVDGDTILGFGPGDLALALADPTVRIIEYVGYCSPSPCYCGATQPFYGINGISGACPVPPGDNTYVTSTAEANFLNTQPGGRYTGGLAGIRCYVWTQPDASLICGATC